MSVTLAPRARIAVKASWPGVSRKVMALPFHVHLVGADVLGDATGLAGDDVGLADLVEQQGLAVVDVAHDGDDRRSRTTAAISSSWSSSSKNLASSAASCCSPGSTRRTSAPTSAA